MRPRILLLSLAAVIIVALVVLSLADSLLVDLLWFSTLGYRQVFIITLGAQVAIFAIVWAVAFLAICDQRDDRAPTQPRTRTAPRPEPVR